MAWSRHLQRDRLPLLFLLIGLAALVVQLNPSWREALVYQRGAVTRGEFWRLWTGHLVHFGWPHFVADAGLLVILGWPLHPTHKVFCRWAFLLMPPFIVAVIHWFDPQMTVYAGLSAINLGLLLYLAGQGWQRNWTDWFWPAILAIYVGEVVLEIVQGGRGGGAIRFDDPTVRVATSAHIASAVYAAAAWAFVWFRERRKPSAPAPS